MTIELAMIGGTGFYDPAIMGQTETINVETEYGGAQIITGIFNKLPVAFLARHGGQHQLPPHRINYRANIAALKKIGVRRILATTAVGSLKKDLSPGTLVIIDQFIDFTKKREQTFYDGENAAGVVHTDFTDPYCPQLRNVLKNVMLEKGIVFADKGTYICTEGPRYETPAEIRAFALWGADVVGMTNVPEVTLAREAGLCYANLSLVTNYAAGISSHPLSHQEVVTVMEEKIALIREIFQETLPAIQEENECRCAVKEDFPLGP